jgi:hypothetical protein
MQTRVQVTELNHEPMYKIFVLTLEIVTTFANTYGVNIKQDLESLGIYFEAARVSGVHES